MQAPTAHFFERHSKITLLGVILFLSILSLLLLNTLASTFLGLGKVVIYQAHPIYGYSPKPNQIVSRNKNHTIKINNLGLRAEKDWDDSPTHKVLFVGDSVTYGGSYIDNSELFSALAVQHYPHLISGNAGVNGWGVNNVHAFIKEMAFLPAETYVSIFPEGDFYRGLQRIGGQPFWTKPPRFALEELFHYFIYKIHLSQMPLTTPFMNNDAEKTKVAEVAVRNLKDLDNYLKSNHRQHIIFISPSKLQVAGTEPNDPILKKLFAKYNLKVNYLDEKLKTIPDEEKQAIFHDGIHLTAQGHQLWAKLIAPYLNRDFNDN
ncbi:MAG: SGNH/GDSL hydrolase family protein [Candidatus Berkiellales bacterium]